MLIQVRRSAMLVSLLLLAGCVERRLWVRTEPEGASVRVNGEELGRSPVSWRFDHYGTVLVEAELDGYEPVQRAVKLRSPWYQKPVLDFFADVVVPARIQDEHEVLLRLPPEPRLGEEEVTRELRELERAARDLRAEARRP